MKNIKRILSLILIIFVILSAFTLNKAIGCSYILPSAEKEKENMPAELKETAIHAGKTTVENKKYIDTDTAEYIDGSSLLTGDLKNEYPIFCRNKRTKTLDGNQNTFEISTDAKPLTVEYAYDASEDKITVDIPSLDYDDASNYWYYNIRKDTRPLVEDFYVDVGETYFSVYVKSGEEQIAKPNEAYILAEMINNNTEEKNRAMVTKVTTGGTLLEIFGHLFGAIENVVNTINSWFGEERIEAQGIVELSEESGGGFGDLFHDKVSDQYFVRKENGLFYWVVSTEEGPANSEWASYVQWGWWHTEAGGIFSLNSNNEIQENFLSIEANTFLEYINNIAKKDADDNYIYNDVHTFSEKSGENYTVVGPEIDYSPKFDDERAEVLYDSDSETYKIGPFSIDYFKYIINKSDGNRGRFLSGIIGYEVKSNIGNLTFNNSLSNPGEYRFYFPDGMPADGTPERNKDFYIEIKYKEGLTEIQDINFKFKYMNAGGRYQQLDGRKYEIKWKAASEVVGTYEETVEVLGVTTTDTDYDVKRKIKANSPTYVDIQDFTFGIVGARWYKETEIHCDKKWTTDVSHKGDLKIVKNVVDQDGNPIQVEEDKLYKFKVTTIRANDDGEYKNTSGGYLKASEEIVTITVPKGSSTGSKISKIETWEGDKAPLYIVEEIEAAATQIEDYSYGTTKIENGQGQYKENDKKSATYSGATVTVTNIYSNDIYEKGRLQIEKEVVDDATKERVFEFDVTVTIDGKDIKETAIVVVPKGKKTAKWVSSEYTWKQGTEASYKVVEKKTTGYKDASGEGTEYKGKLINNIILDPIKVINIETTSYKGKIQIIKQLIDKDGNTYKATKEEPFSFEVYINGQYDRDVVVTVPKGASTATSAEIEYKWLPGEPAPICKVVEKESGEYTLSYIDKEKTLVNGDVKSFTAINANKGTVGNHGSLQILKIVDKAVPADTKFKFEVIVDGKREEAEIIIPNGETQGIWKSEEYYWESSAPAYEIREIDIPSNYRLIEIKNSTGKLQNGKTINNIVAENKLKDEDETGKIKIVKKLQDLKGNTFVADKDYTFKFDIKIDNVLKENDVILTVKKGESEGSVESQSYTWKKNEKAQNYAVIEDDSAGLIPAISNATGVLDNQTIEVIAINKVEKKYTTEIKLYKKLVGVDENGDPVQVNAEKDTEYHFRVFVTKEDGSEYKYEPIVIVKYGENYGFTTITDPDKFTWKEGELPPTFRVEEETPTGEWKEIAIENDNNNLIAGETVVGCYNTDETTENHHKGELQIVKKLVYEEKDEDGKLVLDAEGNPIKVEVTGKEFKFKVEVHNVIIDTENYTVGKWNNNGEPIIIKAGDSWAKEFMWKDGTTPTYEVIELDEDGNEIDGDYGYDCTIKHIYQETDYSSSTGTINGNNSAKELKANNTVLVEVENKFKDGGSKVYKGSVAIQKILEVEDKIALPDIPDGDKTFKFKVTIYYDDPNKYFTYGGNAYNTLEIYKNIVAPDTTEPIEIKYYEAGNAPKYIVEEIGSPSGWELVSANDIKGKVDSTKKAVFTNRLPINRKYILTMELAGHVWNDTVYSNGKPSESKHNGLKEEHEPGMGNVKVDVYSTFDGLLMTLYTDTNGKWQIPTIDVPEKDENDNYEKYFVTYTYDGQTYEPTTPLVDGSASDLKGAANNSQREKYLDNSMAIENSGARNDFNNKFAKIFGGNAIKDDGTTTGYTDYYDGDPTTKEPNEPSTLEYISKDIEYNGYSKKASELVTLNVDGTAKYQMTASTAEKGLELYYPFDNKMALVSVDKTIDVVDSASSAISYVYHAAYPYLNNINLGLVERPHADIAVEKDLEEAIVVINGKIYKYKYGEIANTQFAEYPDLLYKQIQVNQKNINYSLNLYKSDYYYRASVYNEPDKNGTILGPTLENYLKTLNTNLDLDSLNLDIYLTYKISVTNQSDVYDVEIYQISDYVDSSLELVTAPEYKYIDNIDGTPADIDTDGNADAVVVADKPTEWEWSKSGIKRETTWKDTNEYILDNTLGWRKDDGGVEYHKYTTEMIAGVGAKIQSGETVSSKLTFKVNIGPDVVDSSTGLSDCIQLGDKYNIVEIDNYSTYYAGTSKVAGRVDEDSAPGNIAIKENLPDSHSKNSINWYEDDTDRSPVLKLGLYEEVRNINGYAWEDRENNTIEYDQVIGDGVLPYDSSTDTYGEDLIPNMTTELVEKVTINGIDYDFIWPTDTPLGSGTIKTLTTFDSTTATGLEGSAIGKGRYEFTGIPAGDYVVRFTYGDRNTLDMNNDGIIDLDKDGVGNVKYSGQDYKSTIYQTSVDTDADGIFDWNASQNISGGYLSNEWHDLESETFSTPLSEVRVSDARDDESRRLEVIAKSQNMFYENTSIMDINDSSYGTNNTNTRTTDDSLETYYMVANTAKLNMNIESVLNSRKGIVDGNTYYDTIKNVGGVDVHVLNTNRKLSNGDSISVKLIKYDVDNIDFGIETRSENNVVLDKQIEQITLKTSAGDILIDAKYSIDYDYNYDSTTRTRTITPRVALIASESIGTENLQALNRGTTPGDLGFRYLNVDKDLLQGAMITIKYRMTALNTGEVDRCNQALIDLGEFAEETASGLYQYTSNFETQLNRIRTEEAHATTGYVYGQYLGQIYYQGATIGTSTADAVVTSKIKQVIDYVDNDVVFSQMENIDQNTSWTNTSTAELEENRYIDNAIHNEPPTILYIENFSTSDYSDDKILDSRGVAYESESKNNLIVSVENDSGTTLANPNLMTAIAPYNYDTNTIGNYTDDSIGHNSFVNVTVSRYYSSDMDIEEIENIAETLKLYNDVGRRDLRTIQGNTKPALGPAEAAFGENDSSATELITLSPPTGTLISTMLTLQVIAITLAAIAILAGGIYLIKRKVVIK